MIIFGTRGITSTTESGTFYCPRCSSQQPYNLRQVRRFFTLYFIPLIPLDVTGKYIECTSCAGTYDSSILSFDPAEQQKGFIEDLKRIMILMAIADDGVVDQEEMAVIQKTYFDLAEESLSESQITEEARLATDSGSDMASYARQIAPDLTEQGIVAVVQVAFYVASVGGNLPEGKQAQLQQLPGALNISADDFKSIIDHVSRSE